MNRPDALDQVNNGIKQYAYSLLYNSIVSDAEYKVIKCELECAKFKYQVYVWIDYLLPRQKDEIREKGNMIPKKVMKFIKKISNT